MDLWLSSGLGFRYYRGILYCDVGGNFLLQDLSIGLIMGIITGGVLVLISKPTYKTGILKAEMTQNNLETPTIL
jgi:hypothetical protein